MPHQALKSLRAATIAVSSTAACSAHAHPAYEQHVHLQDIIPAAVATLVAVTLLSGAWLANRKRRAKQHRRNHDMDKR